MNIFKLVNISAARNCKYNGYLCIQIKISQKMCAEKINLFRTVRPSAITVAINLS